MISNKFTQPFFNAITDNYDVIDLESAVRFWDILYEARITLENGISDSLIILSDEQQSRLLLQVLVSINDRDSLYYIDDYYIKTVPEQDEYNTMRAIHQDCMDLKFGVVGSQNRKLLEKEKCLLMSSIISEEFNEANENIRQVYLSIEGEEKSFDWILNRRESIFQHSLWKKHERERLGLPPDERTSEEKLNDFVFGDSEILNATTEKQTKASISWRGDLADFAETLYKLERKGVIDLKSYFDNGGTGSGLVREICQLFSFSNDKPGATLNNYLSKIRKSLGRGPVDAGVLKALGRIRGGKMDDIMPK